MGLQTGELQKASETVKNLSENGIPLNFSADKQTISSFGLYLVLAGFAAGFTAGLFNYLSKRILG